MKTCPSLFYSLIHDFRHKSALGDLCVGMLEKPDANDVATDFSKTAQPAPTSSTGDSRLALRVRINSATGTPSKAR